MNCMKFYVGNTKWNTQLERLLWRADEQGEPVKQRNTPYYLECMKTEGKELPKYGNTKGEGLVSDKQVLPQQERRQALERRKFDNVRGIHGGNKKANVER